LTQGKAGGETIQVGHQDIHEDQIGLETFKKRQGFLAIFGFRHLETIIFQRGPGQKPHGGFVIDNQHLDGFGRIVCS
jgi:hypothetical protein